MVEEESGTGVIYPHVCHTAANDSSCPFSPAPATAFRRTLLLPSSGPTQAGFRSTPLCVSHGLNGCRTFLGEVYPEPAWHPCDSIVPGHKRRASCWHMPGFFLLKTCFWFLLMLFILNLLPSFSILSLALVGCPRLPRETWWCVIAVSTNHVRLVALVTCPATVPPVTDLAAHPNWRRSLCSKVSTAITT